MFAYIACGVLLWLIVLCLLLFVMSLVCVAGLILILCLLLCWALRFVVVMRCLWCLSVPAFTFRFVCSPVGVVLVLLVSVDLFCGFVVRVGLCMFGLAA